MTKYTYFDVEIFLFVTTTIKNEETTSHCLGLDLNGLLTRRNFWRIPGTYARKLYDPKMKRIFEIAQANFEKILFIHFYPHKHVRGTTLSLASRLAMTKHQPRPNC